MYPAGHLMRLCDLLNLNLATACRLVCVFVSILFRKIKSISVVFQVIFSIQILVKSFMFNLFFNFFHGVSALGLLYSEKFVFVCVG